MTSSSFSWKSAVGGAILTLILSVPITWRLTRQLLVPVEEPHPIPEPFPWKPMAMGCAATIFIQWIFSYCRKSRKTAPPSSALTDPWIGGSGDLEDPEPPQPGPGMLHNVQRRDVQSQAPTTYTAVRGCAKPRFLPLPDEAWG